MTGPEEHHQPPTGPRRGRDHGTYQDYDSDDGGDDGYGDTPLDRIGFPAAPTRSSPRPAATPRPGRRVLLGAGAVTALLLTAVITVTEALPHHDNPTSAADPRGITTSPGP